MTALQTIIKGAKKLQKGNKNLSWKDAVKKSSVIYNRTKKPATKKVVKKSVKKKAIGKKPVTKKAIVKPGKHTDTKSHNVNIRVMSGLNIYKIREMQEENIKHTLKLIEIEKAKPKSKDRTYNLKHLRLSLSRQKKQLREQNKLITSLLR